MNKSLLSYAYDCEKKLVHIDTVKNGLECNCTCPKCNDFLVAKNDGKIRDHHFAHKSENDCNAGYETIIHIWAKEILLEKRIIPGFSVGNIFLSATEINAEYRLEDLNIVPDVFAVAPYPIHYKYIGTQLCNIPFIIEILVTHKVDEEKTGIIKKAGIPAIEIDLSDSESTSKEELVKEIYNPKNWNFINKEIGKNWIPQIRLNLPVYGLCSNTQSYTYKRTLYKKPSRRRF